jgi:hypothetical protein
MPGVICLSSKILNNFKEKLFVKAVPESVNKIYPMVP